MSTVPKLVAPSRSSSPLLGGHPVRPSGTSVPPATRATNPGRRDPRLWVGVVLVVGSVVVGARVLESADRTTEVWAAARPLPVGHQLGADDLRVARVRFTDGASLERYLPADQELPVDLTLEAALEPGELVPASGLGAAADEDAQQVSLPLPPDRVPPGLGAGSTVDVWVVEEGPEGKERSRLALEEVRVVAVPRLAESFGTAGGSRAVVVAIPTFERDAMSRILSASARDAVQITVHG